MELFEQLRRDRDREGLSELALRYRLAAGRWALESAVPPPRKRPENRPALKLGEFHGLIAEWLIADLLEPREQRHTAEVGAQEQRW